MVLELRHAQQAEATATHHCEFAAGLPPLTLRLTVRLETPGECCANIATMIAFDYAPPLPADVAVRLDDRLYDGVYAALAEIDGPFPPEGVRVTLLALESTPALAGALPPAEWAAVSALGDGCFTLARAAVTLAWQALSRANAEVLPSSR
jgi:hypothetical protein